MFEPNGCCPDAPRRSRATARIHDVPRTQRDDFPERSRGWLGLPAQRFTGLLADGDKDQHASDKRERSSRTYGNAFEAGSARINSEAVRQTGDDTRIRSNVP